MNLVEAAEEKFIALCRLLPRARLALNASFCHLVKLQNVIILKQKTNHLLCVNFVHSRCRYCNITIVTSQVGNECKQKVPILGQRSKKQAVSVRPCIEITLVWIALYSGIWRVAPLCYHPPHRPTHTGLLMTIFCASVNTAQTPATSQGQARGYGHFTSFAYRPQGANTSGVWNMPIGWVTMAHRENHCPMWVEAKSEWYVHPYPLACPCYHTYYMFVPRINSSIRFQVF